MRKYCLSYDAQNSGEWETNELKIKIVTILKKAGATNFRNPVGSTILFEDENDIVRINYLNTILLKEFKKGSTKTDINYYLGSILRTGIDYEDRIEFDKGLEDAFRKLLETIK